MSGQLLYYILTLSKLYLSVLSKELLYIAKYFDATCAG